MLIRLFFLSLILLSVTACASLQPVTTPPPAQPSPMTIIAPAQPLPTTSTAPSQPCTAGDPSAASPLASHSIYMTFTSDGINFPPESDAEPVLKRASVPDAVIGPDGTLWVYFVNGKPGQHGIFAAHKTSSNVWEIIDCVRLNGQFDGNAVDPDITRLPNGKYRLVYFRGNFVGGGTLKPGDPHPIYSAISDDGINFTIENQLIAVDKVTDPSMVQLPDQSWLLAMAHSTDILLASSKDGQKFNLTGITLPPGGIPELGLLPDGRVVLYLERIYVSNDGGQTWEPQPRHRVPGRGMDPSLTALPSGGYAFLWKSIEPR